MVIRNLKVGPLATNFYLLGDEESGLCALIDPGAEARRLLELIRSSGLQPTAILLTHGHFDHYTEVPAIQEAYPQLPVYLQPGDLRPQGLTGPDARLACPAFPNLRPYGEGDVLSVGSLQIRVLETPGHSSGSVTLQAEQALFTGDTLFAGCCGRTDLFRSSTDDMFASLRRLGQLAGDYSVYPGHGESSTLETERRVNPYLRRALQQ